MTAPELRKFFEDRGIPIGMSELVELAGLVQHDSATLELCRTILNQRAEIARLHRAHGKAARKVTAYRKWNVAQSGMITDLKAVATSQRALVTRARSILAHFPGDKWALAFLRDTEEPSIVKSVPLPSGGGAVDLSPDG